MRTIKFRAQDLASNKWLYGDLRHHKDDICIFEYGGTTGRQVKKETVGQSTCLLDKNGKEIYEGDVVLYDKKYCYIAFLPQECGFVIVMPSSDTRLGANVKIRGSYPYGLRNDIEVVGDIHNNKDLLELSRKK